MVVVWGGGIGFRCGKRGREDKWDGMGGEWMGCVIGE